MKTKTTLLTVAILAGLALPALAERGPGGHGGANFQRPSFSDLDLNEDGQLTLEELQSRGTARFEAADTDGNGELTAEELNAAAVERARRSAPQRTERMLEALDADGNGTLSLSELEARGRGDMAERMFQRFDADENGAISEEEFGSVMQRPARDIDGRKPHGSPRHGGSGWN